MVEAMRSQGFALLDILQPCITFNKLNTFRWYQERVYRIDGGYDPADREAALRLALEFGDRIPSGVIYRQERATLEELVPAIAGREPLVRQPFDRECVEAELERFY